MSIPAGKTLTQSQRKYLKSAAHSSKPVVTIGNKGLSESVVEELKLALGHHELIKVKLPAGEKSARMALIESICRRCEAGYVNLIGRTAILFKAAKESKFQLPK